MYMHLCAKPLLKMKPDAMCFLINAHSHSLARAHDVIIIDDIMHSCYIYTLGQDKLNFEIVYYLIFSTYINRAMAYICSINVETASDMKNCSLSWPKNSLLYQCGNGLTYEQ